MTSLRIGRRTLLRAGGAAALLGTAPGLAGACGGSGDAIQVVVVWSGGELAAFRQLMDRFERDEDYRWRVDLVSAGDQIGSLLAARREAGRPPDVAVLSQPRLIRQYACDGALVDPLLPASVTDRVPCFWRQLASVGGTMYGVWVKAAHKSLLWYRESRMRSQGPPRTWSDLETMASRSGVAALSIGAADGWVLSDWFENALAAVNGDVYDTLASDPSAWGRYEWALESALSRLADVWSPANAFPYDAERMLLTQFEESVAHVFDTGKARLVFEGDFVSGVGPVRRAGDAKAIPVPATSPQTDPPIVVGGDAAVLMQDTDGGRALVRWLASPRTHLRSWADDHNLLTPGLEPKDYFDSALARRLSAQLSVAPRLHFDLDDQVAGALAGADGRGLWRILQSFFARVALRGRDNAVPAIRDAVRELVAAADATDLPECQTVRPDGCEDGR